RARPHDGQVRRDRLVEANELVGLRAAEPPATRELGEPLPLGLVRESEGVEVHDRYPSGSGSDGERSIQGGHVRDGIVTGEGVVVDARPAAFLTRGLALLLDLVLLTVVILL